MSSIDTILDHFERGRLTRRQLVQTLAAVLVPVAVSSDAAAAAGAVAARTINHVQLTVADMTRAKEYYVKLLGVTKSGEAQGGRVETMALPGNSGWISLRQATEPNEKVGTMDHFAVGVEDFKSDRVAAAIKNAGFKVDVSVERSVFITDPDGFRIQLISKDDTTG